MSPTGNRPGAEPASSGPKIELESASPEETAGVAARLAAELAPGDVVLLSGEVGAGKSTFARAAMRALGVEGAIPSPTFTIGRLYSGRDGLLVSHLDLYRIASVEEEDPGLLIEYLDPRAVVFAEWPGEDAGQLLGRAGRLRHIHLEHLDRDRRSIRMSALASG